MAMPETQGSSSETSIVLEGPRRMFVWLASVPVDGFVAVAPSRTAAPPTGAACHRPSLSGVHRAHVASYIVEEERAAVVVERTGPAELVEPLAPAVEKAQGQDDEPWYENLRRKVQSQGQAGFIALLAETVVFWVACLIPAALIIWHQQSGSWNPDSDPESWATFTATVHHTTTRTSSQSRTPPQDSRHPALGL